MKQKKLLLIIPFLLVLMMCFACAGAPKFTSLMELGTYSGYKIELVEFEHPGVVTIPEDTTLIYVGDVLIAGVSPYCDFIVYTSDDEWVLLEEAYDQGIISHDDLLELAALCARNAPEFEKRISAGTYSGYKVEYVKLFAWQIDSGGDPNELIIDGVYLYTGKGPNSHFIVYTSDSEWILLEEAYDQGLISHDDLLAIREAMRPYDYSASQERRSNEQ